MANKDVVFYVMNSKGLAALKSFISIYGSSNIKYVVCARDRSIHYDAYEEIHAVSNIYKIDFYEKKNFIPELLSGFDGYSFAIGWRWIIEREDNLIIFHDSLLPRYRGFAPLVHSLVNEESQIGVTALFANKNYDCGNIIMQKSTHISYPIKINDAIKIIEPIYANIVVKLYGEISEGKKLVGIKQNEDAATYGMWLDSNDYFIDWRWAAKKIKRFVDAVGFPYDGARSYVDNEVIIIKDCNLRQDLCIQDRDRHLGKIIFMHNSTPTVICGQGLLDINDSCFQGEVSKKIAFRSRFT